MSFFGYSSALYCLLALRLPRLWPLIAFRHNLGETDAEHRSREAARARVLATAALLQLVGRLALFVLAPIEHGPVGETRIATQSLLGGALAALILLHLKLEVNMLEVCFFGTTSDCGNSLGHRFERSASRDPGRF